MENIYTNTNATFTTANGETVSYQEIFESVRKSVEIYGKAGGRDLSAEELEDLFQDSILKALKYCKRFDPTKAQAKTWASRIAFNAQRDAFREHNKHLARFVRPEALDEDGEPDGSFFDEVSDGYSADREVEGNEAVERIMAALAAYTKLQFSDEVCTDALAQALLRYCELDTMSMVFIWEYFNEMTT